MAKSTVPLAQLPDVSGIFVDGTSPRKNSAGFFVPVAMYSVAEVDAAIAAGGGGGAVASVNGLTGVVVLTTTQIAEGTRLYYTTARVQADAPNVTISGTANGLSVAAGQILSLAAATSSNAGAMTAAYAAKLDGIAAGATANTGTVTSVALTLPGIFSLSGSPITTAGTFAATLTDQTANFVFAGPVSSPAATPAFRALVAADIPVIAESGVTGLVSDLAAKVPTSRTVSTTSPMTGGGALSGDLTLAVPVFVASGASHATGLVPDPGASGGTTRFLREDATFAVPAGGSAVTQYRGAGFNGQGAVPTAGQKYAIRLPMACTITAARISVPHNTAAGSAVVGIAKVLSADYTPTAAGTSIVSNTPPTLTSASQTTDTTLTGWTTALAAGDWLVFTLTSASTLVGVEVQLTVTVP